MADVVYILCALTSTLVAVLLLRGWSANRAPQLLWTGIAFAVFAVNNIVLVVDLSLVAAVDLRLVRSALAALATGLLVTGLVWER